MNTEKYYDIITKVADNWPLNRREATLLVTALTALAKSAKSQRAVLKAKATGVIMGFEAANHLNEYQYEDMLETVNKAAEAKNLEEGLKVIEDRLF
jgi:hypothetical protein